MKYAWLVMVLGMTGYLGKDAGISFARKGDSAYQRAEYGDAEVHYRRALQRDSANWQAMHNLGNVLYRQERYQEAAGFYQRAVQHAGSAESAQLLHNLGNAYLRMEEWEKSIQAYQASLRQQPSAEDTRYNLAYAQQMLAARNQPSDTSKKPSKDGESRPDSDQTRAEENNRAETETSEDASAGQQDMSESEMERVWDMLTREEENVHRQLSRQKNGRHKKTATKDW